MAVRMAVVWSSSTSAARAASPKNTLKSSRLRRSPLHSPLLASHFLVASIWIITTILTWLSVLTNLIALFSSSKLDQTLS